MLRFAMWNHQHIPLFYIHRQRISCSMLSTQFAFCMIFFILECISLKKTICIVYSTLFQIKLMLFKKEKVVLVVQRIFSYISLGHIRITPHFCLNDLEMLNFLMNSSNDYVASG